MSQKTHSNALAEEEIFKMVLKSDLDFRTAPWPSVSDAAKDCVKRLLTRNSSQRATAADVLNHPWLTQQGLQSDRPLDNVVIQRMRQVCHCPAASGTNGSQYALTHAKGSRNATRLQFGL